MVVAWPSPGGDRFVTQVLTAGQVACTPYVDLRFSIYFEQKSKIGANAAMPILSGRNRRSGADLKRYRFR
jgi:hypothetical protein